LFDDTFVTIGLRAATHEDSAYTTEWQGKARNVKHLDRIDDVVEEDERHNTMGSVLTNITLLSGSNSKPSLLQKDGSACKSNEETMTLCMRENVEEELANECKSTLLNSYCV